MVSEFGRILAGVLYPALLLAALLALLTRLGRMSPDRAPQIAPTYVVGVALALAITVGLFEFVIFYATAPDVVALDYFDRGFAAFSLRNIVVSLLVFTALSYTTQQHRLTIRVITSMIAFIITISGGFTLVFINIPDVLFSNQSILIAFEYFFSSMTNTDRYYDTVFLRTAAIFTVANFIFLQIAFLDRDDAHPIPANIGKGVIVTFKSSANEPLRLLCGLAATGRLPEASALKAEAEHPCHAAPLPVDVDRAEVLALVRARDEADLPYHVLYIASGMAALTSIAAGLLPFVLLAVLVAGVANYRRLVHDRYTVAAAYLPEVFKDERSCRDRLGDQNLVTYADYYPFHSFGIQFGNWVLSVDTGRRKDSASSVGEVDLEETERRIMSALRGLGVPETDQNVLYFVQGANIPPALKPKGPHRPPRRIDSTRLREELSGPDAPVRRYLWVRKSVWSSEISVSYFIRLAQSDNELTLEITGVVMPPVDARHRWIDEVLPQTFVSALGDFVRATAVGVAMMIWSSLGLFVKVSEAISRAFNPPEKVIAKQVGRNPRFDFGAPATLRRRVADTATMSFFQNMDRRAAEIAFAGRTMRAFIDYLDECGVDTSELREQRTTILNHGIVVQGGDLKAENIATGIGARIKTLTTGRSAASTASAKS